MIWPISVKFGQVLEKYITNKNVSGNVIILKILSLKAISTPTRFLSFWDPDLEKKNKLPKYKNRIELELLNDDLDLQVPTLRKTWEFTFLKKQ